MMDIIKKYPDTSANPRTYPQTDLYRMDIKEVGKRCINVKDVTKHFGNEIAAKGKVLGYLQRDRFTEVYIGAKDPNNPLLVI